MFHCLSFKSIASCRSFCKNGIVLFLSLITAQKVFPQADVHSSQFYETSILRNPALTGIFSSNYKISVYYRNQWSSITNPYQTIQIDGEYRFSMGRLSNDYFSVGLLAYSDEAGDVDQKITAFYAAVNYNKSINTANNSYLSFGFAGGSLQYSVDLSKATFNNQFLNGVFDPGNPVNETLPNSKMSFYDLGAGANYNFNAGPSQESTYMFGVSAYHLTQPIFSYYKTYGVTENVRYNLNADMSSELNENVLLQAHVNYTQQGPYNELIGGALLGWQTFETFSEPTFQVYAGVMYRYQDAIIPVFKIRWEHTALGLSYDLNTSSLKQASNAEGGFEITAYITGNYPPNANTYAKTVCPRFQ